jgi:hypothetical protein
LIDLGFRFQSYPSPVSRVREKAGSRKLHFDPAQFSEWMFRWEGDRAIEREWWVCEFHRVIASEATQSILLRKERMDFFVASLLAMTTASHVARMSEATSGLVCPEFPHGASLMRATEANSALKNENPGRAGRPGLLNRTCCE